MGLPARLGDQQGGRDGASTWSPTRRRSPPSSARTSSRSSRRRTHIEQAEAKKVYEKSAIPIKTLADRDAPRGAVGLRGKRIVIFSGGAAKENDDALLDEYRAIRDGGGFGSIMGRNSFQRAKPRALEFLATVMKIYSGELK